LLRRTTRSHPTTQSEAI